MSKLTKLILLAVIIVIVTGNILIIIFVNNQLNLEELSYQKELKVKDEQIEYIKNLHQSNIIIAKENENLKLKEELKLVTLDNDTIFAKNLFVENSLVLSYSILNCGDCINAEFENLKKYAHDFSENIIIIAYFDTLRDAIFEFKKLENLGLGKVKFFVLTDNDLGIPMDKYNNPYYFHIDKNLTISNVLLPIKGTPRLSEYYLKYSFKNYFN